MTYVCSHSAGSSSSQATTPSSSRPRRSSPRCCPWSTFGQKSRSISPRPLTVASSDPLPRIAAGRYANRRPVASTLFREALDGRPSATHLDGEDGRGRDRAVARAHDCDRSDLLAALEPARVEEGAVRRAVVHGDARPALRARRGARRTSRSRDRGRSTAAVRTLRFVKRSAAEAQRRPGRAAPRKLTLGPCEDRAERRNAD